MKKQIIAILIFLLTPFIFVSANNDSNIENIWFNGGYFNFRTEIPSRATLHYISQDQKIEVILTDSVYGQTHSIKLWNLDFFNPFNYILKTIDYKGNESVKEGGFEVVPADPEVYERLLLEKGE